MVDLEAQIEQMIDYINELEPEVRVKFNPLDLQEKIGDHVVDVLLDTGWLISVYVFMPEQQIAAAQCEQELAEKALKAVEQRREAAQQILAQAKELGLIPVGVD